MVSSTNPVTCSCAAHVHALTKSILQLYETLPLILNNSNSNNPLANLIFEDTTSLFPEVSVKSENY